MRFDIEFSGHENVRSLHRSTIEITRCADLTPSGDCIIGVNASHACGDIPYELMERLRSPDCVARISIIVGDHTFEIRGRGHAGLALGHTGDIVIRKSGFVCSRTLAVGCDRASADIPREIIRLLQNPLQRGLFRIEAA